MSLFSAAPRVQPARRVVIVGDVHGDYDQFFEVLLMAGVVSLKAAWTGGSATLIQLGDVVDRGPHARRVLDLLMSLQKQAAKAGGRVEMLLGNHEVMRMAGDLRHVHRGEYEEFLGKNSEQKRDALFERQTERIAASQDPVRRADLSMNYRSAWEAEHPLGSAEMIEAFSPKGVYGKWLRERPVATVAGDTLCVHAGISSRYALWTDEQFRMKAKEELSRETVPLDGMLMDEVGPCWWRGLVTQEDPALTELLDSLLPRWNAKRIIAGHTPMRGPVRSRLNGRVLLADVGLSRFYGGPRACVVIEDGEAWMLMEGRKSLLK